MKEILGALSQNPAGIFIMVWMGLTVVSFIMWYGFYVVAIPVMSIISGTKSLTPNYRKEAIKQIKNHESYRFIHSPRLGFTMADGGKPSDEQED